MEASKVISIDSCNNCGRALKDDWNFCPFCKSSIETFHCVFCDKAIRTHWKYCPYCKNEVKSEHKNNQRVEKCNEWLRDILRK